MPPSGMLQESTARRYARMRYALTTVSLPALSLEETVAFAARLGYEGLEWRVRRIPPT